MTVAELIEALQDCPEDYEVMISDSEIGLLSFDKTHVMEFGLDIAIVKSGDVVKRVVVL